MERTKSNAVLMGTVLAVLCLVNVAAWRESLDITNLNVKNNLAVANNATVAGTIAVTGAATLGSIDGESISDDTIDDDAIDFSDVTGADLTLTDCTAITVPGNALIVTGSSTTSTVANAAGYIDGEVIGDDTIDDDSIDLTDVTVEDFTLGGGTLQLVGTALQFVAAGGTTNVLDADVTTP